MGQQLNNNSPTCVVYQPLTVFTQPNLQCSSGWSSSKWLRRCWQSSKSPSKKEALPLKGRMMIVSGACCTKAQRGWCYWDDMEGLEGSWSFIIIIIIIIIIFGVLEPENDLKTRGSYTQRDLDGIWAISSWIYGSFWMSCFTWSIENSQEPMYLGDPAKTLVVEIRRKHVLVSVHV